MRVQLTILALWLAGLGVSLGLYVEADSGFSPGGTSGPVVEEVDGASSRDQAALPWSAGHFRGDRRHTGRTTHVGPRDRPKVVWRFEAGGPITAQVVMGEQGLFVGSHDHFFYALTHAGALRWKRDLGDKIYAAAWVDAHGNVYVGSDADSVYAFDPEGGLRWQLSTEGDADTAPVQGPDGTLYVAAGRDLFALTTEGSVRWRFRAPRKIFASPAVADDGTLYVGAQDGVLYALSPGGDLRWAYRTRGDLDADPAIGDDGSIYAGSDDGHVYAFTPAGALRWATPVAGRVRAPVALAADGSLITGVMGPRPAVVALDRVGGRLGWRFPVSWADSNEVGIVAGPLVDAAGRVYVGAHDGHLYALEPSGVLRWTFEADDDIDAEVLLGPDGTIYVATRGGTVYALRDTVS